MHRYLAGRLISLLPTLLGLTVLVFLLVRLIPGTVVEVMLGTQSASEETIRALREFFGLDQPLHVQYLSWIARIVRGDFGSSWRAGRPVLEMILQRLPVTAELTVGSMVVALLTGIPLGVISAVKHNTPLDNMIRVLSLLSLSLPVFFLAALLILILSVGFRWGVPVGYVGLTSNVKANLTMMFLPMICLGVEAAATITRMTRSCLLETLGHDYIRTARAKGLAERFVVWKHALRNAMIPVVTVVGYQVGYLLAGTVVIEEVFSLPGVGRLLLYAIYQRDYPLLQGAVLFVGGLFVMSNLAVDLLYGYLDPRIAY